MSSSFERTSKVAPPVWTSRLLPTLLTRALGFIVFVSAGVLAHLAHRSMQRVGSCAWSRLARDLDPGKLARATQVVALEEVPAVVNRMVREEVQGRMVVDVNA